MIGRGFGGCHAFVLIFLTAFQLSRTSGTQGQGIGRLTGVVTDEAGMPIEGAKIFARFLGKSQASLETKTDRKGQWRLLGLGGGDWNIMASADGYDSANRDCFVRQLYDNPRVPLVLAKIQPLKQDPRPAGLLEKANDFFYLKKYGEAAAGYEEYLRLQPEDVMVRLSAGDCYRENGDLQKAIEAFGQVVEMTSKDPLSKEITARGLTGLGECYFKTGDLKKAESYFRSSIELSPENAVVAYNLAEVCFSLRKVDEAIRNYELAARLSPYWSDPCFKLGYAYLNSSRFDKAGDALQKFLTLEPNGTRAARAKRTLEDIEKIKLDAGSLFHRDLGGHHFVFDRHLGADGELAGDLGFGRLLDLPLLLAFLNGDDIALNAQHGTSDLIRLRRDGINDDEKQNQSESEDDRFFHFFSFSMIQIV
jgi:tetratricopeptide (TPR) repeat protein